MVRDRRLNLNNLWFPLFVGIIVGSICFLQGDLPDSLYFVFGFQAFISFVVMTEFDSLKHCYYKIMGYPINLWDITYWFLSIIHFTVLAWLIKYLMKKNISIKQLAALTLGYLAISSIIFIASVAIFFNSNVPVSIYPKMPANNHKKGCPLENLITPYNKKGFGSN
jgi:hypothetical protein